jgi:hypothetical protein
MAMHYAFRCPRWHRRAWWSRRATVQSNCWPERLVRSAFRMTATSIARCRSGAWPASAGTSPVAVLTLGARRLVGQHVRVRLIAPPPFEGTLFRDSNGSRVCPRTTGLEMLMFRNRWLTLGVGSLSCCLASVASGQNDAASCRDHPMLSRMKNYYIGECKNAFGAQCSML